MKAQLSILDVMQDEKILGKMFKRKWGKDTWATWKIFLRLLFALPMTAEQRKVYEKYTGRTDIPSKQFRECYVICGRRSGKSLIAALIAVYFAIFRDYSEVLQAGEAGEVQILAADRKQARVIFGYVNSMLSIPLLKHMVTDRLKETIVLDNHIRIVIRTSSYKSIRGYTVVACVADEVAFWESEDSSNPAEAVLTAIRPSMATVPEPLLIAISSPYSRRGVLWDAFRQNYGQPSKVLVWKADSQSMNPTLDEETVAEAYARDPSAARAEFGGEFREDVEDIFSQEMLEARIIPGRKELPPDPEKTYFALLDPSGGKGDSFTLGIAHVARDKAILDLLREVQPPFSPETVAAEFSGILKAYGLSEATGDNYGGAWPQEQFAKYGINYRVGTENRSEIYLRLLPALMSNQVELLDNPRMVQQLVSLERRTSRGGRDTIDHPVNAHDDVANAAGGVLAVVLASNSLGTLGLIEYFKRKAQAMLGVVGRRETIPPSVEVAASGAVQVDNFAVQKARDEASRRKCPECKSTAVVELGAPGNIHCNSCASDFDAEGNVVRRAVAIIIGANCCEYAAQVFKETGKPHALVIAGGETRCLACGKQSGRRSEDPAPRGVTFAQLKRRRFGGFMIDVPDIFRGRFGRFGR